METVLAVIPARYGSTRFPGKPLVEICGKPMIQHVYENVKSASTVQKLVVATDDNRIRECAEGFGGEVIMTSASHRSGTDRVAEASGYFDHQIIVNVQGDEPLIDAQMVDEAVSSLLLDERARIATLACDILDEDEYKNPNVVKVVTNRWGSALYFSRSPIPFYVDAPKRFDHTSYQSVMKHVGLYVYRKEFLLKFATSRQGILEKYEHLEQLRALEFGHKIKVVRTKRPTVAVDAEEDLERVRVILEGTVK